MLNYVIQKIGWNYCSNDIDCVQLSVACLSAGRCLGHVSSSMFVDAVVAVYLPWQCFLSRATIFFSIQMRVDENNLYPKVQQQRQQQHHMEHSIFSDSEALPSNEYDLKSIFMESKAALPLTARPIGLLAIVSHTYKPIAHIDSNCCQDQIYTLICLIG